MLRIKKQNIQSSQSKGLAGSKCDKFYDRCKHRGSETTLEGYPLRWERIVTNVALIQTIYKLPIHTHTKP